ncbi:MAG: hypothetical protein WC728_02095 [Elusimicrobiota bacterium]
MRVLLYVICMAASAASDPLAAFLERHLDASAPLLAYLDSNGHLSDARVMGEGAGEYLALEMPLSGSARAVLVYAPAGSEMGSGSQENLFAVRNDGSGRLKLVWVDTGSKELTREEFKKRIQASLVDARKPQVLAVSEREQKELQVFASESQGRSVRAADGLMRDLGGDLRDSLVDVPLAAVRQPLSDAYIAGARYAEKGGRFYNDNGRVVGVRAYVDGEPRALVGREGMYLDSKGRAVGQRLPFGDGEAIFYFGDNPPRSDGSPTRASWIGDWKVILPGSAGSPAVVDYSRVNPKDIRVRSVEVPAGAGKSREKQESLMPTGRWTFGGFVPDGGFLGPDGTRYRMQLIEWQYEGTDGEDEDGNPIKVMRNARNWKLKPVK